MGWWVFIAHKAGSFGLRGSKLERVFNRSEVRMVELKCHRCHLI